MEADSSSDDEDSFPLYQLFGSPSNTRPRTLTIPVPATAPKKFKKNDIVWAKIPPHSWSPAQITALTSKSTALVSLLGSNSTHLLEFSEICGFEENYAQMARCAGAECSDEVGIALEELSRRAAMGMMCSCRRSPNRGEMGEFEPREMMEFVRDMAVCAWVGVDDAAVAVRLSAQVNGYRHYVSVCRTSGIDEGFRAEDLLGFLKALSVSWGSDEWEGECLGGEVGQIDACRRFVCVRPDWMLPQRVEVEEGFVGEEYGGSEQDMSGSSIVGERASGIACRWEDDGLSTAMSEGESEICQEQMHCVINTEDFSILDLDEEYESMISNPLEPDITGDDNCGNENLEMDDVCSDSSSQESDIEVEMACTSSFLHVTDTNQVESVNDLQGDSSLQESETGGSIVTEPDQTEADGSKFLVNEEPLKSSNCHNAVCTLESTVGLSWDLSHSAVHGVSDTALGNNQSKEESIVPVTEDVIPLVPSDDCLQESTPSSKRQAHPCDEMDVFQYCATNRSVDNHHGGPSGGLVDVMSNSHRAEASEEPLVKKRKLACDIEHDIIFTVSISSATAPCVGQLMRGTVGKSQASSTDTDQSETLKTNSAAEGNVEKKSNLRNVTAPSSRKIQYSTRMMRHINSARGEILSHIKHIAASKSSGEVLCKPHSTGKGDVSSKTEPPNSSDSAKPACKKTSHQNKKHNQHTVPDWRRYYASPLVSCAPKSPIKARKPSSEDDKFRTFPKSLHMKFPRDFDIPSKEKLAETFEMFGPVDFSRTKVSPYTGAAQVFFLRQVSAYAAHEYVKKRNVFGQANVRFWVDQHENHRKGAQVKPILTYSSSNLKSCLKRTERDKEKRKVRFSLGNEPVSVS